MTKSDFYSIPINSVLIVDHPDSVINGGLVRLLRRKHGTRALVKDLLYSGKEREFSIKFLRLATDSEKEILNGKLSV